ncbi:MAG: twin-arginine translocation signal domain-containing protein, partial [Pirellulaceae bacterium]
MLTIQGPAHSNAAFCDRVSRRNFLKVGSLGVAGLTLPHLLRAEAAAGVKNSNKSVIMIYLVGGPPHQDMFDLKPNAP